MIIAIDGPAASGKGTLGRLIAKHYGLQYLDTGSLYRAVARDMLARGYDVRDADTAGRVARTLDPTTLDDLALRSQGVGEAASIVASFPQVRQALLDFQHKVAATRPGAVLDGRDIGTVVCPDADAKIFVNADVEIRAHRRFLELKQQELQGGEQVTPESVLLTIKARDERDQKRASSPLRPAEDAYLLETSKLTIEGSFDAAVRWIERKIGREGSC